jgi:hypothetical protein
MATHVASAESIDRALELAFAPIHKRAFGVAVGTAAALCAFVLTAFHVVARPEEALNVGLLHEYFYGYSVTWPGALIGAAWAFFTGYVAGWFLAFCRNLMLGIMLFIGRTRSELEETRDFLDHI